MIRRVVFASFVLGVMSLVGGLPISSPVSSPVSSPTTKSPTAAPTTKSPTAAPTTKAPSVAPTRLPTPTPTYQPTTKKPTPAPTYTKTGDWSSILRSFNYTWGNGTVWNYTRTENFTRSLENLLYNNTNKDKSDDDCRKTYNFTIVTNYTKWEEEQKKKQNSSSGSSGSGKNETKKVINDPDTVSDSSSYKRDLKTVIKPKYVKVHIRRIDTSGDNATLLTFIVSAYPYPRVTVRRTTVSNSVALSWESLYSLDNTSTVTMYTSTLALPGLLYYQETDGADGISASEFLYYESFSKDNASWNNFNVTESTDSTTNATVVSITYCKTTGTVCFRYFISTTKYYYEGSLRNPEEAKFDLLYYPPAGIDGSLQVAALVGIASTTSSLSAAYLAADKDDAIKQVQSSGGVANLSVDIAVPFPDDVSTYLNYDRYVTATMNDSSEVSVNITAAVFNASTVEGVFGCRNLTDDTQVNKAFYAFSILKKLSGVSKFTWDPTYSMQADVTISNTVTTQSDTSATSAPTASSTKAANYFSFNTINLLALIFASILLI